MSQLRSIPCALFSTPIQLGEEERELSRGTRFFSPTIGYEKRNGREAPEWGGEKNVSLVSPGCRAIIEAISRRSTGRF